MNNKRLLLVSGLATILAVTCLNIKNNKRVNSLYAYEDISINSDKDAFRLLDKSYNEAFGFR